MRDKIYLRPKTDEAGNTTIVDQNDREVAFVKYQQVTSPVDDPVSISLEVFAGTKTGAIYIDGQAQ